MSESKTPMYITITTPSIEGYGLLVRNPESLSASDGPLYEYEKYLLALNSDLAAALAERDALAARVAEAEAWQPITTCPESCRGEYPKYVLFYNGHHTGVGFCYPSEDDDGGTLYVDETDQIVTPRPTHWMPLPSPPTDALSREEKS